MTILEWVNGTIDLNTEKNNGTLIEIRMNSHHAAEAGLTPPTEYRGVRIVIDESSAWPVPLHRPNWQ